MIKYSLICESGHTFDGWFSSSQAFDDQAASGQVGCPLCGSAQVAKALMAPYVATHRTPCDTTGRNNSGGGSRAGGDLSQEPRASQGTRASQETLDILRKMRRLVRDHAEYVGDRFAEEARRMHYDEIQRRSIYGEATADEAQELREEGVEIHPLACLPEDHN